MKKLFFITILLASFILAQGQSCNISTVTPSQIFYAGNTNNTTYNWYPVYYLCQNATVYDTLVNDDSWVIIDSGATFIWKGGTRRSSSIWIKNGGTLYLKPNGSQSSRGIFLEPGATIIDPSNLNSMFTYTVICSSINLPSVNCFTGIQETTKKNIVSKIYPNPNNGTFIFYIDTELVNGNLILTNSLGQKIHIQKVERGENEVKLKTLPKGLFHYFVLENNNSIGSGKIGIE